MIVDVPQIQLAIPQGDEAAAAAAVLLAAAAGVEAPAANSLNCQLRMPPHQLQQIVQGLSLLLLLLLLLVLRGNWQKFSEHKWLGA